MVNLKAIVLAAAITALSVATSGCMMVYDSPRGAEGRGYYNEGNYNYWGVMMLGFPGHIEYAPAPRPIPPRR